MAEGMTVEFTNLDKMLKSLEGLPDQIFRQVLRRAVRKGTEELRTAYGDQASRSGLGSLVIKRVKEYRQTTIVGIAGMSYTQLRAGVPSDSRRGTRDADLPSNIDYLLEYGHRIVVGGTTERTDNKKAQGSYIGDHATGMGRVVGWVPGYGYGRKAADSTVPRVANTLVKEIAAAAIKLADKKLPKI